MSQGVFLRLSRLVVVFGLLLGGRIADVSAQLPADAFRQPTPRYNVGAGPTAVTARDLNGDGLPDLAVANGTGDSVTVLLNQGNGTFLNNVPSQNIGGERPVAVVSANLNGQARHDLAFANEDDDSVSFLLNTGNGTFGLPQFATTSQVDRPISIAVANFDTDTDMDLAVASFGDDPPSVTVLLNNGTGSFTPTIVDVGPSACCTFPRAIVTTDLDSDGDMDLAVAMVGNFANGWVDNIAILLNDGSGDFREPDGNARRAFLPVEDDTCDRDDLCHFLAMATADVNGDGFPDLVVAVSAEPNLPSANTVFILLNRGNHPDPNNDRWLGFAPPGSLALPAGSDPRAITLADVDGDGDADLITANRGTNRILVRLNNGNGTFAAARSFVIPGQNPRPVALTMADLDGDCDLDIAVANSATNTVAVLFNQIPQSCPTRDLNADGRTDLVWRNTTTGRISVWFLDGLTRLIGSLGTVDLDFQIAGIGDVNGDGSADLIWYRVSTGKVSIWLMNGLQRLRVGSPGTTPGSAWQIKGVCDADGDRKADLVWYNADTGGVLVWLLNGLQRGAAASPGAFRDLDWQIVGFGDVNDDNRCDIVWRHNTTGQNRIWLLDGTARQDAGPIPTANVNWQIGGVGDTNGDGNADLVWHNTATGAVSIWLLDGFTRIANGSPGTMTNLAWQIEMVGDTNGDGKADLVWRNRTTGRVLIWLLDGVTMQDRGFLGQAVGLDWQIQ